MHTAHLLTDGKVPSWTPPPIHSTPFSRHPFMAPPFTEPLLGMVPPAKDGTPC